MFTEEFRKYLLIGGTVLLFVIIIICSNIGSKGLFKNSTFSFGIIISESLDSVNDWISRQFSSTTGVFDTKKANEILLEENEELKFENSNYAKYKTENEELKKLLGVEQEDPAKDKITCRVVGVDPNNTFKVYILNKGEKDNIKKDMIVLSSEGLAGRIVEVGKNYSKFMAVTDDRTTIGVSIERTGEKLVLNGNNISHKNTCKIENIDLDTDVLEEDMIITSNVSMLYPEGLKVGTVQKIKVSNDGLTKTATVNTFTNVNSLNYVYVIKNKEMLEEGIEEVYSEFGVTTTY